MTTHLVTESVNFNFISSGLVESLAPSYVISMQAGIAKRNSVTAQDLFKLTHGYEIDTLHTHAPGYSKVEYFYIAKSSGSFVVGTPVSIRDDSGQTLAYKTDINSTMNPWNCAGLSLTRVDDGGPVYVATSGELLVDDLSWDGIPNQSHVSYDIFVSETGNLSILKPVISGQKVQKVGVLTIGNATTTHVLIKITENTVV